jgi:hypothetical protein
MNFQKNFAQKISFILIISILSLNLTFLFVPKKANADPTGVIPALTLDIPNEINTTTKNIWDIALEIGKKVGASWGKLIARQIILEISQATVDWINNGFNGSPAYIADTGKFLSNTADNVVGQFIQDSNLNFLCSPFQLQVKAALQLGFGNSSTLKNQIGCTFSEATNNITNSITKGTSVSVSLNGNQLIARNNTTGSSNADVWSSWLKTTLQPQNNPIGAYIIAKGAMDAQVDTAKNSASSELAWGQGSLSLKSCVNIYQDLSGNEVGRSDSYINAVGDYSSGKGVVTNGSNNFKLGGNGNISSDPNVRTQQKCTVETPGSAITGLVIQKANSDQNMNEMAGALSDGIDAVLGALENTLLSRAIDALKNGILNTNTKSDDEYRTQLANMGAGATTQANDAIDKLCTTFTNTDGSTYSYCPSVNYGNYSYTPTPTTNLNEVVTTPGNPLNYTGNSPLALAQKQAAILLGTYYNEETNYLNTYQTAQAVLTTSKVAFASSSVCDIKYGRPDLALKSELIRSYVIAKIDGNTSLDNAIPWNLKTVATAIASANTNIAILNTAQTAINDAQGSNGVSTALTKIYSTSFHTDPELATIDDIKAWLRNTQSSYNSTQCPIDLTAALKISTTTNSTNYTVSQ